MNLETHPNIVRCLCIDKIFNLPCICIEYVNGGDLEEWIKNGKIKDLKTILAIAIQIANGMEYIHSKGLIHGDLKPKNILVNIEEQDELDIYASNIRQEESKVNLFPFLKLKRLWSKKESTEAVVRKKINAKITDFGNTRKVLRTCSNDSTNQFVFSLEDTNYSVSFGTPAYMAPEQWKKSSKEIGKDTDVYAFGLILFELITQGRKPYELRDHSLMKNKTPPISFTSINDDLRNSMYAEMHSNYEIPDVRKYGCCPDSFVYVIENCLQKDPKDRWRISKENGDYRYFKTIGEQLQSIYENEAIVLK